MTKRKVGMTAGAMAAVVFTVAATNYFQLQQPMSSVREADPRNDGIRVSVHYEYYVNPNVLVYDLREVSSKASPMDVTRVFLQFAERQKEKSFSAVQLAHQGEVKFLVQGDFFQKLGKEYGAQNPMYTLRTLPENLFKPDGKQAFGTWTGGMLGVLQRQMEDFTEWHRAWYIKDMASKVGAN